MSSALDALAVALALVAASAVMVGVGSLLTAILEPGAPVPLSTRFWLGVCGTFTLLEPLHLVLPVAGAARVLVAAMALAGLWLQRGPLMSLGRALHRAEWVVLLVALGVMARLALGPGPEGDSALYHYPAVRWAASYPVVPGVGNLNPFLGYSHGHFLLLALLDAGPFVHRSHHLLNPLLVLVTGARCLREATRLVVPSVPLPAVVGAIALLPMLGAVGGLWLVSPSSNLGESLFVIVLVLEVLALLRAAPEGRAWVVMLLAVGVVEFKLSAAVVAAVAGLLALRQALALPRRARWVTTVLGLVGALGWLAGGAVRTGYVLYPMVFAPLPVDWRMDPAVPASVTRYISAYTKGTVHRLLAGQDDGAWWGPWFERALLDNDLLVPTLIWLTCVVLALGQPGARRRWWWLAPSTLGLVAWFVISPDPQYLGAVLVLQTGVALGLVLDGRRPAVAAPVTLLVLGALVLVTPSVRLPQFHEGGLVPAPLYPTQAREIPGGPVSQSESLDCGDNPLPCSGIVEPGLRYRRAGDLGAGFAVGPGVGSKWRINREFLLNASP